MPERQIDPARMEGEALRRWYLRSPDEIEQERQAKQAQGYQTFFGGSSSGSGALAASSDLPNSEATSAEQDVLWMADGRGGYRAVRPSATDFQTTLQPDQSADRPDYLPNNSAAMEGGELTDVGNPHNPRLRREWERANEKSWPRTEDGRRFHVSHKVAIADGGTNTLDNIEPMHPEAHVAHHMEKGDYKRWGGGSGGKRPQASAEAQPSISRTPDPNAAVTVEPVIVVGRRPNAKAPARPTPAAPKGVAAKASALAPPRSTADPASTAEATRAPRVARIPAARGVRIPRLPGLAGFAILSDILGVASGRIRQRTDTWDNYRADLLGEPSAEDRRKAAEDLQRLINPNWKPGDPWVA